MWLKRYMLGDVAIRYIQRRSIVTKGQIVKGLQKHWKSNRILRFRESKFQPIHEGYLRSECFQKLFLFKEKHKAKMAKYRKY